MFKFNPLVGADGYKPGHIFMLAPGTTRLYGTWIPRTMKRAPKGITKVVSIGQNMVWKHINNLFNEHFFMKRDGDNRDTVEKFGKMLKNYYGVDYDSEHFRKLHTLGYLPLRVKALPEGLTF
jgi:nicotinamide phosphoribosyltransferase